MTCIYIQPVQYTPDDAAREEGRHNECNDKRILYQFYNNLTHVLCHICMVAQKYKKNGNPLHNFGEIAIVFSKKSGLSVVFVRYS